MSTTTAEKILENFPHPHIQPIVGQPTYESIAEMHLKLNANADSVHTNLGNGKLGFLYLTVEPSVYNSLSTVVFVPPVNPDLDPIIPTNATGPQIAELRRKHKEKHDEFQKYINTDKAVKL